MNDAKLLEKYPLLIVADAFRDVVLTRKTGVGCRWSLVWWLGEGRAPKAQHTPIYAQRAREHACKQGCKHYVRGLGRQLCFGAVATRAESKRGTKCHDRSGSTGVKRRKGAEAEKLVGATKK